MTKPEPYALTEADLMDLRVWAARTGFISDGVGGVLSQAPWITFVLSTKEYCLHSQGATVAVSTRDEVICALLRSERLEPGFCRRAFDPLTPVDVALRTPEEIARWRTQRNAEEALARHQRLEAEAEARRRRAQLRPKDPTSVTFDDLFT